MPGAMYLRPKMKMTKQIKHKIGIGMGMENG